MVWQTVERVGYGSNFNRIDISGNIIRKRCINTYGLQKIKKEIKLFDYIRSNAIEFSFPKIYEIYEDGYSMQYYKEHIPLYKVFLEKPFEKKIEIIRSINISLEKLHSFKEIPITKDQYIYHLIYEIDVKLRQRKKEINLLLEEFQGITSVNGMPIRGFDECLGILKQKIEDFYNSKDNFSVCVIHGDCQFNNILYHEDSNDLVFIDPRGYYGEMDIFGIKEYDFAKVKFALSGYDIFDNRAINSLDIVGSNINIPDEFLIEDPFDASIESILAISFWLGNASTFKSNKYKCAYSYFKSLYYATKYL